MNISVEKHSRRLPLRVTPRRSAIASACSTLLLAAGAAHAQQAPAGDAASTTNAASPAKLEAVVVTGIRHGIESSVATKRNSDSIVEAVSAEDIGKLPDVSIAESLARLPGLA
ncbi:MAG TPA: TonB-dependent receptor, partial [Albitalea sp.]|nr:TonB-dependent receptor [Albitalea sp.]